MTRPPSLSRPRSPGELFTTFTLLALQGFGGVLAVVQRVLCEQKGWLTREEFLETMAVAQVLPGPNVCNVSLMIGDRFFGFRGALAALSGMLLLPAIGVLALASLESQFAAEPSVQRVLRAIAAVTAGMVVGTALKLAAALHKSPLGVVPNLLFGVLAFVAIALLRLPLPWTMLLLGGAASAYAAARLHALQQTAEARPEDGPK